MIAERTGISVISNFRSRDMAAGGQGAPLVPFVDYLLFSSDTLNRVALNIGGISNLTWLPAGGGADDTVAYDTGPGNMIIDALVQHITKGEESFDCDGLMAGAGTVFHPMRTKCCGTNTCSDRRRKAPAAKSSASITPCECSTLATGMARCRATWSRRSRSSRR